MSEMMYDGEFLIIDHGHPCCPHRYRVIEEEEYMRRVELQCPMGQPDTDTSDTSVIRDCLDEK